MAFSQRIYAALPLLACVSCCPRASGDGGVAAGPVSQNPSRAEPRELTLLYTSDEHGWIEAAGKQRPKQGGLLQLYSQLLQREQHCQATGVGDAVTCGQHGTLLLSGGDNYTGPALSSHFQGRTTAQVMARLGYVASAFGNHELDFGRAAYLRNRETANMTYLAANVSGDGQGAEKLTQPFMMVERAGVRVGVIGVATVTTPKAAMASLFEGVQFEDMETALMRTVPQVWELQPDVVVLLAHECAPEVRPMVARHPEWRLSFVGAGHCHGVVDDKVDGVPLVIPDWRARRYAKVVIRVEPDKPLKRRATVVQHEIVPVTPYPAESASEQALAQLYAKWQSEVAAKLGQPIGYSSQGMAKNSRALSQLVLRSWLTTTNADLAITTQGGIRQELPAGTITREKILSVLPFQNELYVCRVPGDALSTMLEMDEVLVRGVQKSAKGQWLTDDGKPLDPARSYSVVTTDFLYGGGDNMPFAMHDKAPTHTAHSWRQSVVDWLLSNPTSSSRPLEALLLR